MYLARFGLHAAPFALTPDTAFAFPSRSQREALDSLLRAVEDGDQIIEITGEVGTGKTLLCRRFLDHAAATDRHRGARYRTAYVPNPCLSRRALLLAVARELRIGVVDVNSDDDIREALDRALLELAASGSSLVLCLDDAQAMSLETLDALRPLSGRQDGERRRLQVLLLARPELDRKLARHDPGHLHSRITSRYCLGALSRPETEAYLAHRLLAAGRRAGTLFAADVAGALHDYAGGVPRLVNLIAHKSLLLADGQGDARVTRRHVRAAAADTPQVSANRLLAHLPWWRWRSARAA